MDEGSPASRPEWLWRWYRDLVERVPAVPYLAEPGPAGVWTYVSPQIERLLGFTPDEWLADPELWSRQIHPDDRERVVEHELAVWEEATAGDPESLPLVSNEYRMLTRDGRTLWVRDEAFVATDHEGRPSALRGLLLDITEQKRAEMALRAGEARLREAQEIAHVGSWEWDVESDTVTWSDELYRIFGLGVADLTPTRDGVMDRIHPDDHERAARAVDEALRGKPLDTELRVVRPDGTVRVVHARAKVTPDDAGNPARLTGTAMDVTERKALEEALAHQAFYDPSPTWRTERCSPTAPGTPWLPLPAWVRRWPC